MKIINHSIVGSGLSAFIKDQISKNSIVFTNDEKKIVKSKNFYEYSGVGGSTNVWGGYINFSLFSSFLRNKKFKNFYNNQKKFCVRSLYINKKFRNTYYISNYSNLDVFRIKKELFNNKIIVKKINKISFSKKKTYLHTKNNKILTKKLSLCIGNLGLIELFYNSKILKPKDKIQFHDGKVSYSVNFFLNLKKYYYIPLTIKEIIIKLFKNKKKSYQNKIKSTFIVQKFEKKYTNYTFTVEEIMKFKSKNLRYFLSNHVSNLRINDKPINLFIKKYCRNVHIYNSGAIKRYTFGPVSQSLIYNALIK